jgi:hypothetical protein
MSNYEFLDKHIHRLNGVWPDSETAVSEPDIWFYLAYDYLKEEFQQRARELGYGVEAAEPESWYCYETQKALRLPPVGSECIVLDNVRAKIVGQTASGYLVYQSVETGFCEMACQATSFKPLDWNRKKYEAIEAASKCFHAHCMHDYSGQPFIDGLSALYDAGFLRMPEDK